MECTEMSNCTCTTDKEITCIVHPTEKSLRERIAKLEEAAQKVVNCLGVCALWSWGEVATAKEIRKLEAVLKQEVGK
jgi:hypothetical protein